MKGLLLCALLASAAVAQPAADPAELLRAMSDAAGRLDYATAEARAREALGQFDTLTPDQLVTVHTTLGILLHVQSQPVEARRQFEAALSLAPSLRLDSVLVSPKTVEFFDAVRAEVGPASAGGPAARSEIRYVVLEDRRPAAALRSLALPGWGQFHKDERAKGWAFALAAGTAVVGTVVASVAREQARDDYLAAATPTEAARLYPSYNRWERTRTAFRLGTAAVWAAATLDALATGGPATRASGPGDGALSLTLAPGGVRIRARF